MTTNLWTRDELILALNLYLKLPFGKIHSRNPSIIHFAKIIGRTPNSIALRLVNFASVDPYHQNRGVVGMRGGIRQVQPIWDEFIRNKEALIFESERILAQKENQTIEIKYNELLVDIGELKGETRIREVKTRVNQNVFRQIVLANYSGKCAITGIDIPDLLIASHIIPWSENEKERLNPRNGIAINAMHDKAFEKGLITITPDYRVKISSYMLKQDKNILVHDYFNKYQNKKIILPNRFLPDSAFLKYHNHERFNP
jgi:putative restriction endonuclease